MINNKIIVALTTSLFLGGCVNDQPHHLLEKFRKPPQTFNTNSQEHGIKATIEYKNYQIGSYYIPRSRCAAKIDVENYGNKNYRAINYELSIYTASKELIAKNTFRISSGLIAGGKVSLPAESSNALISPSGDVYIQECPDNMLASIKVIAY